MHLHYSSGQKTTKKERAVELYEKSLHLPKEKLIRVFIKELNLPSENSARTYISMSKKALASKIPVQYKKRKIDARKTKKGRAMELFNDNPQLSRKEMIELFEKELNMTFNSAATHCSMCAREYTGPKHEAIV
jgi:hypothetical protein